MKHKTLTRGFSFVELLIIVAVALILFIAITNTFSRLRNTQILNSTVEQISALINEAHFKTLGSKKASQYGIHFETNRVVLFEGKVFLESDPNNKEFIISEFTEISSISLNGGGSDLIFDRLTGETDQYGTVIVRVKTNTSKTKEINIENNGAINTQF